MKIFKVISSGIVSLGIAGAILASLAFIPTGQATQAYPFEGATITTTAQSKIVACGQDNGSIGRKTFVVNNDANSDGIVTVTVELRDYLAGPNFTSGYMALNEVAAGTLTYTTRAADTGAAGWCQISAISASTSTITVTMRKE
jgi:hypothetical protein